MNMIPKKEKKLKMKINKEDEEDDLYKHIETGYTVEENIYNLISIISTIVAGILCITGVSILLLI